MHRALQTDAELFPFDDDALHLLDAGSIELHALVGHEPDDIVAASSGIEVVFHYLGALPGWVIEQLVQCRVIARMGMGFDTIDVTAARARGIEVVYVPDFGGDDVADHALALLLACARRLVTSGQALRAGTWPSYGDLGPMRRLKGQILGLLGFGRIARGLAKRAQAFGLVVIAYDPAVDADTMNSCGVEAVSEEELYQRADFVSIHVPLSAATHHLVDRPQLDRMKPTAYLINTSRGGVVRQEQLVRALSRGSIAGAGLDVFEVEPLPTDDPLRSLENVVLSPHSASFAIEALAEVRRKAIHDVVRVLNGESPVAPVPAA
jgi:D-3-phosphoglycerate dehydrogenase / 2-oxoglutarate reductase